MGFSTFDPIRAVKKILGRDKGVCLPDDEARTKSFSEVLARFAKAGAAAGSRCHAELHRLFSGWGIALDEKTTGGLKHVAARLVRSDVSMEDDVQLSEILAADLAHWRNVDGLLSMYQLLLLGGFFQSALWVRNQARSHALDASLPDSSRHARRAFSAALEVGDFDAASKQAAVSAISRTARANRIYDPQSIVGFLREGNAKMDSGIRHFDACDRQYLAFVRSRSVAILGPAPDTEETAEELRGFDILIRTNYLPPSHPGPDAPKRVAYFSNDYLKSLGNSREREKLGYLDYCIYRRSNWIRQARGTNGHGRVIHRYPWRFHGIPNAIPDLVYDTLLFSPSRLKIFNATLMLDTRGGIYQSNYFQQSGHSVIESFGWHDPLTQFYLLKNLYAAQKIEVEQRLAAILHLSEEDYMTRLQQQFFHWARG